MNTAGKTAYDDRVSRVCDYIYQNLNDDLTLDTLSSVAALSKYHFHRIFSAYTGMSVTKFIQLTRLRRAGFQLAFENDRKIIEIAADAMFDSPEAFSRAFKRIFGQTPSQFRKNPEWPAWHSKFQLTLPKGNRDNIMDVRIVSFPETTVALIEHCGAPERIYETASKFIAWRKETQLSPIATSKTFGIPYSDPKMTEPENFRFDICGSIDTDIPENTYGVKAGIIPSGRCAVVQHHGNHDTIEESIYHLYREWLPHNDEEVRDHPCFFHYLNFVHEVDEYDLLTDIYLPLK